MNIRELLKSHYAVNQMIDIKLEQIAELREFVIKNELRREVIKAVEELGEPDSSIIFRKFYYGESSKDIAKAVGLTVSNVDTRTHRALNKLRKMFGGNEV